MWFQLKLFFQLSQLTFECMHTLKKNLQTIFNDCNKILCVLMVCAYVHKCIIYLYFEVWTLMCFAHTFQVGVSVKQNMAIFFNRISMKFNKNVCSIVKYIRDTWQMRVQSMFNWPSIRMLTFAQSYSSVCYNVIYRHNITSKCIPIVH